MFPVTYQNTFRIDTITRPANVTAYTVGQVINETSPRFLVFPITVSRRGGYITRVSLVTSNAAHTAALRLWLFDSTFTAPADQTTPSFNFAQGLTSEGYVDFAAFVVPSSSTFAFSEGQSLSRPLQFQSGADNNVYGLLEARAAFTPTSGQQFGIQVYSELSA